MHAMRLRELLTALNAVSGRMTWAAHRGVCMACLATVPGFIP